MTRHRQYLQDTELSFTVYLQIDITDAITDGQKVG